MDTGTIIIKVFNDIEKIDFLRIAIIFIIGLTSIRVIELLFPWLDDRLPGRFRLNLSPSVPVWRLLITVGMFLFVFPEIINPTKNNLLIFMGAVGVALGFALKEFANNVIAGIVATYEGPYRPGDWVQIDDIYGEVKSLGLRALYIVTPDDTLVAIPHKKIWDTGVFNANAGHRDLQCVADFYIDPDHDPIAAREKLHDVALCSSYVNLNRPIVVVMSEKPWYSHYKVKAYPIDSRDQFQFVTDLTMRGKAALKNAGIFSAKIRGVIDKSSEEQGA